MNGTYHVIDVYDCPSGIENAIGYIHSKWGNANNLALYRDAILHYGDKLPRFFLLMDRDTIIGCGALITNDFVSRQDLWPWYACHFLESSYRGRGLGSLLLSHAIKLAVELGFPALYLSTDHDGYYEKYGWQRVEDAYDISGAPCRVYRYDLS
jgi:GNAT superfamily N-acetyltransferase